MKGSEKASRGRGARFWLVLLPLVAVFSAFALSCGGGGGNSLKIGILFSYTGDLSEFGPNMEHGADLAAKQINDAGGVLGKDVVLKTADDATSPDQGVQAARQLVDSDKVQAIVGSLSSGVTLAAAESVVVPAGKILISPASTSVALTSLEDSDLVFRTTVSDLGQGPVLAQVAKDQGYTKVSTLYVNNAYGEGLSQAFSDAFEKLGGQVLAQVPHEQEQATYLAELQKATADKPDALAALSYPQSATVYLKEALENNLIKTFLFCDGTQSVKLVEAVGATPLEGMVGTAAGVGDIAAAWRSEFEAEYGALPTLPYITESYDGVVMIALGAAKAAYLDPAKTKADSLDPAKIRDAMRTLNDPNGEKITANAAGIKQALDLISQGKAINYQGASGFSGWDANGDVKSGYIQVWKFEGGKIANIKVVPVTVE